MECLASVSSLARALMPDVARGNTGHIRLRGEEHSTAAAALQGPVDILALGSGWTWSFLGPAAGERGLTTACTTRDGREGTVPFVFDPESDETAPFEALPDAKTVVIIFPLYSATAAKRLVHGYTSTRKQGVDREMRSAYTMRSNDEKSSLPVDSPKAHFILLGSTGIWNHGPTLQFAPLHPRDQEGCYISSKASSSKAAHGPWVNRHAPIDKVPRAQAEDALLAFNKDTHGSVETSVLCLSGLWGHGRSPRRYIGRLAPTKEQLSKLTSVHLVHGHDVARALLAMHEQWQAAGGQRWLLTNERVYDLWDLISQWGDRGEEGRAHFPLGPQVAWIQELIAESRRAAIQRPTDALRKDRKDHQCDENIIRSLPRSVDQLGFGLDGTDFWNTFQIYPEVPWVD